MNKKILTLQGKSKTGKTTTLKLLIDLIEQNFGITVLYNSTDEIITAVINGKTLGVTTCGDTKAALQNDFGIMGECDLYVCASRTKGETIDFLESESRNGMLITHGKWYFDEKSSIFNADDMTKEINQTQAEMIFTQIIELLQ